MRNKRNLDQTGVEMVYLFARGFIADVSDHGREIETTHLSEIPCPEFWI
jgi:hypothetical protein